MANNPNIKPGMKKTPGSGRKKGTPNKRTYEFMETLTQHEFNPAEKLIHIYNEAMAIFDERKKHKNYSAAAEVLSLAQRTAGDLAQYAFPRKRAIEHTGELGLKTFADFIAAADDDADE